MHISRPICVDGSQLHMRCGAMEATKAYDYNGGNGGDQGEGVGGYGDVTSCAIGGIGSGDGDGGLSEKSCGYIVGVGDCCGISRDGPMGSEPPCPMANTTRGKIDDNQYVPPFLIKLYLMVDDETTNSIISWGSSWTTFVISDEQNFISQILPCYFKTSRLDNFISQLNNYGFKKNEWNRLEFKHEHFQQGKLHLLKSIKRKNQKPNVINKPCVPINELKATFRMVKHDQKQISNRVRRFKFAIEQTLSEIQAINEAMINKLLFTCSKTVGRKRTFLDIDLGIHLVDIKKDFQSICEQFDGSGSDVDCFMTLSDLAERVITRYGGGGGEGGGRGDGCRIPKFLHTLYNMVSKEEIDDLVSWKHPHCDSFIIGDINKFATHVLPMYFKHTNFSSFNSQLNIYGFKKVSWDKHEYANEWFRRGRYDLLANIKRRSKNLQLMGPAITCSTTEVERFNSHLKTIQQDQENRIIWLSNYEEQIKSIVHEFKENVVNMANVVEKMIQKSDEKLETVKKAKLETKNNIIGDGKGQEPEVNGLEIESRENDNLEEHSYFQELGFDHEVLEKVMKDPIMMEELGF
ncbi:hypothetical protein L1987_54293 [Smallanthus sonchifolius]|uniref:Uncharacterized protein n=1 Tax=Smallanthus sonchifolius TaxID=185202 RepID=A0ACB9E696_9ASTR|nr:hypothetical protein L1987_54293 [Smallanthus sonchifolius]